MSSLERHFHYPCTISVGNSALNKVSICFHCRLFLTAELLRAVSVPGILGEYPRERCGTEGFDLGAFSDRVSSSDLGPLSVDPGTVSHFSLFLL